MDAKEHWLLSDSVDTLIGGTFDESDLLAFLMLLRDHTRGKSIAREFGDFVAHRERDRGILRDYVNDVQSVLSGATPVGSRSRFTPIRTEDVQHSFNEPLRNFGLPEFDTAAANAVTVGIIALLQSVEITVGGSTAKLSIGISVDGVALLGQGRLPAGHTVSFPMLVANNTFEPIDPAITQYLLLDRVTVARCKNGKPSLEQRAPAA